VTTAGGDLAVVVATQGHYDEEALEAVLHHDVPYVGLVASRKRAAAVRSVLEANGVPGLARIRNPAGLDLGARTPSEVALAILAEIVQQQPSESVTRADALHHAAAAQTAASSLEPALDAVDPVCGMQVDVATSRHTADVERTRYYFCCALCRARFVADPQQFLRP
jgi:xanthine dehydrogenase accessory factor